MDTRIEIWNVLHDGEITAISQVGDTLTMFVSIPYLRLRLKPLGDSFVLTLAGVRQVEYRDFKGTESSASSLQEQLGIGGAEIIQTESESMPITIDTTLGQLILDFQSIEFALDTGQPIEYETIVKVCVEYWAEWRANTEQVQSETVKFYREVGDRRVIQKIIEHLQKHNCDGMVVNLIEKDTWILSIQKKDVQIASEIAKQNVV